MLNYKHQLSRLVQELKILNCFREVPVSNLDLNTALSCLRFFVVLLRPFRQILGQYLKLGHNYFHYSRFFIWFVRLLALRPLLAYCASLG
jgi:hypothetical protein